MAHVSLSNMQFYAHHGCFDEEQRVGTRFLVSVDFEYDSTLAEQSDNITDALNYAEVYLLIKEEMEQPSHLLEHVARRIRNRLLSSYPAMQQPRVEVSKLNPPLGGQTEKVSVIL